MSRDVTRILAAILLMLATFGLVLSPVMACHAGMQPVAAEPVAEQSSCHEAAEAPADEPAPARADVLACCKTMCAPALPAMQPPMADRFAVAHLLHAPAPA